MAQTNKIIDIIGVQSDFGASCRGADIGPKAMRLAGVVEVIRSLGFTVCDFKNIATEYESDIEAAACANTKNLKNLEAVNTINTKLYKTMCQTLESNHFPLVLGGDHSLAAASVTAIQKNFVKAGLIWVDAHGDFNNSESSPSGNIHGMPLSAITGNGTNLILPFMEKGTNHVDAKNVVIIAARTFDDEEKNRIKNAGITVFSMTDIDRLGIGAVMNQATQIAANDTNGIYLSFDLDSVDPSVAPGVGTPSLGGLTLREAHFLCEYLSANSNLLGCEIVELNPILDNKNQTAEFAVSLIASLLGKVII